MHGLNQIVATNAAAQREMNARDACGKRSRDFALPGAHDPAPHSGVQAWSKGDIFPAVIARRESYTDAGEFRYASHVLILDGCEDVYASYDDAHAAARALLARPAARELRKVKHAGGHH